MFGCKRPHGGSLSLPIFANFGHGRLPCSYDDILMLLFIFLYIINVEKLMRLAVENTLVKLIKKSVIL